MKRKTDGKYLTTRAQYKDVKKFDHSQLDAFCTKIYQEGYKDGMESVPGADMNEVMEKIRGGKGIGEKRRARIEAEGAALLRREGETA